MAWEYLDNLSELTGTPCSFNNGTTWNDFLSYIPSSYYPAETGDIITLGNIGAYSFLATQSGQEDIYTTTYGLKIEWTVSAYSSQGQSSSHLAVYAYDGSQWVSVYNLGGLMHKGSMRFAVDYSLQQAVPVLVRSFYNNPWYTEIQTSLTMTQANKELLYQVLMNGIPSSATEAGAGSGYIGNSLLSNKKMVGYNVPTSSDAGTETESTNEYHSEGVAGKAKVGNGKVKITFLG